MKNNDGIKLFNTPSDNVVMPTVNNETVEKVQKSLMSDSIDDAISGHKVKTLILPEGVEIAEENFIFDFSKVDSISIFQKEALKGLVSKDGNVALYLYRESGLVKFGVGDKYTLERIIPLLRKFAFDDEVPVYKNVNRGKEVIEINGRDITQLRLHL